MTGYGKFTLQEGAIYEGFMKNNKFHGKGLLHTKDG
jgi:hypothetical protein